MIRRLVTIAMLGAFLLAPTALSQEYSVSLDYVSGLSGHGSIRAGELVTFHIRITNAPDNFVSFFNAFSISSPDGAEWSYPVRDTVYCADQQSYPDECVLDSFWVDSVIYDLDLRSAGASWIQYYSIDGAASDTVQFFGYLVDAGGYNAIPLHIPIQTRAEDIGKTICIDSVTFVSPEGWGWWPPDATEAIIPAWSGPHCFTIAGECCNELTGNVDADLNDEVDIGDLTALIDHLYISSNELPCPREANLSGDTTGLVDIDDLTRMIDYLYIDQNLPAHCDPGLDIYSYTGYDDAGIPINRGWLGLRFFEGGPYDNLDGQWSLTPIGSVDRQDIGSQIGRGSLQGYFNGILRMQINLNPGWFDDNVILDGYLYDGTYYGNWRWSVFWGTAASGTFEAVKQ